MKSENPKQKNKTKKYPFYFYLILFLIPFLFFLTVEFLLKAVNYGKDIPTWVQADSDLPNTLMLNNDIASRYFSKIKKVPNPATDGFDRIKKNNAIRIFVLGESSAAGYPYEPNAAFSKYIKQYLQLKYPDLKIEVINLAMSAVNSFTMLDIAKDIPEQKPDLVLIYAGHNEYYGALGVGSTESLGRSIALIKFVLWAEKFKTVQLIKNAVISIINIFSSDKNLENGTLMEKMVDNQLISYKSPEFNEGIDQWKNNLESILTILHSNKIPVVLSTVVSNLKDQKPFVSVDSDTQFSANKEFSKANSFYYKGDYINAKKHFILAKEYDVLRFRAPDLINETTQKLGKQFHYPVLNADSVFTINSPHGIVGDNLMTDHLHPNYEGYRLLGKAFLNTMTLSGFLPKNSLAKVNKTKIDSMMNFEKPVTLLDSTLASFRIKILKSKWPFVKTSPTKSEGSSTLIKLNNLTDSLAFQVLDNQIDWGTAHFQLGKRFLHTGKTNMFLREMDAVIFYAPYLKGGYQAVVNELIASNNIQLAYPYLLKLNEITYSSFSAKWLGIIELSHNNVNEALPYLESSYHLNPKDPQMLYNLAGAYYLNKENQKAYKIISECVAVDPNFPGAQLMKSQLQKVLHIFPPK